VDTYHYKPSALILLYDSKSEDTYIACKSQVYDSQSRKERKKNSGRATLVSPMRYMRTHT
jgi:hypothetical protein